MKKLAIEKEVHDAIVKNYKMANEALKKEVEFLRIANNMLLSGHHYTSNGGRGKIVSIFRDGKSILKQNS